MSGFSDDEFRAAGARKGATPEFLGEPAMSLLGRTVAPAPRLPIEVFGAAWSATLEEFAGAGNVRPDYLALALLTLAGSQIGNARWIRAETLEQPPVIWGIGVGTASSKKSSSTRLIMDRVVRKIAAWIGRHHADELAAWDILAQAAKENGDPPPPKPIKPLADINDTTTPSLVQTFSQQPKGVCIYYDEISGWFEEIKRPTSDSRSFYLKCFDGSPYTVTRVKFPEPVHIPRLSASMFGTIQPDKMAEAMNSGDDGMLSRFFFSWPEPRGGFKLLRADIDTVARRMCRLSDLQMEQGEDGVLEPRMIDLCEAGQAVLGELHDRWEALGQRQSGRSAAAIGKAFGQSLRLALVLEYLWWCEGSGPEPTEISLKALEGAAILLDSYFIPMAVRVYGDVAEPVERVRARTLAEWIVTERPTEVSISLLRDRVRLPGLRETVAVERALSYLTTAHWLMPTEWTGGMGAPKVRWIVNEKVFDMTAM